MPLHVSVRLAICVTSYATAHFTERADSCSSEVALLMRALGAFSTLGPFLAQSAVWRDHRPALSQSCSPCGRALLEMTVCIFRALIVRGCHAGRVVLLVERV